MWKSDTWWIVTQSSIENYLIGPLNRAYKQEILSLTLQAQWAYNGPNKTKSSTMLKGKVVNMSWDEGY